jgi:hypothetical protein
MMPCTKRVAIVGNEEAKFTPEGEERALVLIRNLLVPGRIIVSGHCHLGGVDIWAEEEAKKAGLKTLIFPPKNLIWSPGFRERNIQIAENCDEIHVICVDRLPSDFKGMRFKECYHCINKEPKRPVHVKSGACWTANWAIALGKPAFWHVAKN